MANVFDRFDRPSDMRVDPPVQASRDQDRMRILNDELTENPNDPALKAEIAFAGGKKPGNPFDQFDAPKPGPAVAPAPAIAAPAPQPRERNAMQRRMLPVRPKTTTDITQAPYDVGGLVTDAAAKVLPPWAAAGAGYLANVGTSMIPFPPGGAATKGVAKGVQKVGRALTPEAAPDVVQLARKAEEYGIPLRPDMLGNNKVMKIVGEALEQVPLSGSKADPRQSAFNSAIMKTIGAEGDKLTPDVFAKAIDTAGKGIGDISEKYPIPLEPLRPKLQEYLMGMQREVPQVRDIVNGYVSDIQNAANKGAIDGVAFRKLRTKMTAQMRRTSDGDLKHALSELDDVMLDAIEGNLNKKEIEQFTTYRRQYANAKTLEPLVAKSPTGDLSPSGLMGRVTSNSSGKSAMAKGKGGDLGDLARIGQRFVKEPGSSNTAERSMAYSALGGSGLAGGAPAAAALWGGANLYNRFGPRIAKGMIPKPP